MGSLGPDIRRVVSRKRFRSLLMYNGSKIYRKWIQKKEEDINSYSTH